MLTEETPIVDAADFPGSSAGHVPALHWGWEGNRGDSTAHGHSGHESAGKLSSDTPSLNTSKASSTVEPPQEVQVGAHASQSTQQDPGPSQPKDIACKAHCKRECSLSGDSLVLIPPAQRSKISDLEEGEGVTDSSSEEGDLSEEDMPVEPPGTPLFHTELFLLMF